MAKKPISCIFLMADYGHDPTETAIPFTIFTSPPHNWTVTIATERGPSGPSPRCDSVLLTGLSSHILGASSAAKQAYSVLTSSPAFQSPLSWSDPSFTLAPYDVIFLPGGHEKGVRQIIDSPRIHALLGEYFPLTARSSQGPKKTVVAICHGVQVLSAATLLSGPAKGKSVLHDVTTTSLPAAFERFAFWSTRLWLGDYYKTYGYGSQDVEDIVRSRLDEQAGGKWMGNLSPMPFVVEDPKYNYLSARFPGDAEALAKRAAEVVEDGSTTS